ncbi:MAG: DUF4738 domain-containing protein [Bacteroides sp.]|jgi:hypothetical protein|nr:DUF4738 domain-containing protein [Bacteroides sp.]
MIKWSAVLFVLGASFLISCSGNKEQYTSKEDVIAKEMLQGIWVDDETEMPLIRIKGDTIYYTDSQNMPTYFKIIKDTVYVYGSVTSAYKIDKQTEFDFWFHSISDEIIKLHKSDNPVDNLSFGNQNTQIASATKSVMQKDSIVMYNGIRYRGYVYINPSKIKVIRTSYTEDGISVDNIYFDNIIHICVYKGKELLYGKDIKKQMFSNQFPDSFLNQAILYDMRFMGVDARGYHYQATLNVPESSISGLANLTITMNKQLIISKVEN